MSDICLPNQQKCGHRTNDVLKQSPALLVRPMDLRCELWFALWLRNENIAPTVDTKCCQQISTSIRCPTEVAATSCRQCLHHFHYSGVIIRRLCVSTIDCRVAVSARHRHCQWFQRLQADTMTMMTTCFRIFGGLHRPNCSCQYDHTSRLCRQGR